MAPSALGGTALHPLWHRQPWEAQLFIRCGTVSPGRHSSLSAVAPSALGGTALHPLWHRQPWGLGTALYPLWHRQPWEAQLFIRCGTVSPGRHSSLSAVAPSALGGTALYPLWHRQPWEAQLFIRCGTVSPGRYMGTDGGRGGGTNRWKEYGGDESGKR